MGKKSTDQNPQHKQSFSDKSMPEGIINLNRVTFYPLISFNCRNFTSNFQEKALDHASMAYAPDTIHVMMIFVTI